MESTETANYWNCVIVCRHQGLVICEDEDMFGPSQGIFGGHVKWPELFSRCWQMFFLAWSFIIMDGGVDVVEPSLQPSTGFAYFSKLTLIVRVPDSWTVSVSAKKRWFNWNTFDPGRKFHCGGRPVTKLWVASAKFLEASPISDFELRCRQDQEAVAKWYQCIGNFLSLSRGLAPAMVTSHPRFVFAIVVVLREKGELRDDFWDDVGDFGANDIVTSVVQSKLQNTTPVLPYLYSCGELARTEDKKIKYWKDNLWKLRALLCRAPQEIESMKMKLLDWHLVKQKIESEVSAYAFL